MIPEKDAAAVSRGLQEAFGTTAIDEISRITKGLSSDLVFRIVVGGSPYLLRIMTKISEQMDPSRIFACMSIASEAGITPRVRYCDVEHGVSITDFIEGMPLPQSQAFDLLPRTLRTLHGLPPFPKAFNYTTSHKYFVWRLRGAQLLPENEIDEVFAAYEQICATYPCFAGDMVSSHMDLKPDNILYDGDRIWLVDWQSAFLNDRYFDLAVAAHYLVASDKDEAALLEHYFAHPPDEYQRARFFLMRQAVHMLAAAVFVLLGSGNKLAPELGDLPSFEEFHRRIWAAEVNIADKNEQVRCGILHWKRLRENLRRMRFADSLQTIRTRHPEGTPRLLPTAT